MPTTDEMAVFLVPYDDSWPRQFAAEAALIEASLDVKPVSIEHIGSTAIPGIAAKPIIDIMVLINSIGDAQRFSDQLKTLEYHYHPYGEDLFPERRWHCKPNPGHRTHHLHLVEADSKFHFDHLLFRDFLRANREEAVAYERLKISLAMQFPDDRESYTDGKSAFVGNILKKAAAAPQLICDITCPECAGVTRETMPSNACQWFYECPQCQQMLKPRLGDCCVFCSYGSVQCPPKQTGENCCA